MTDSNKFGMEDTAELSENRQGLLIWQQNIRKKA